MSKNKKRKNKNKIKAVELPLYRKIYSVILLVCVLLSTFMILLYRARLSGDSLYLFPHQNGISTDYFLYVKEVAVMIIAISAILFYVGEKIYPDKPYLNNPIHKNKKVLVAVALYVVFVVLSALFSRHKEVVIWGSYSGFEGLIALFSYVVLFLAGYNYYQEKEIKNYFIRIITVYITIVSVLSIIEYLSVPVVKWPVIKAITGYKLKHMNTFKEAVLMSYNSDYLGSLIVLLFPVSFYYFINECNKVRKTILGIVPVMLFIAGVMTNSTAAIYLLIAELIATIIFAIYRKLLNVKLLAVLLVVLCAFVGIITLTTNSEFLIKSLTNSGTYKNDEVGYELKELRIENNRIIFSNKDSQYSLGLSDNYSLSLESLNDSSFELSKDDSGNVILHDDKSDSDIKCFFANGIISIDFGYKSKVYFGNTFEGIKYIGHNNELLDDISVSEYSGNSFNSFASGRGFIWLNSLSLLKETVFLGKGVGNFIYEFDQNYVVDLLNTHGDCSLIVDKPHSFYLGVFVENGLPALIIVLYIFVVFVGKGFKLVNSNKLKDDNNLFVLLYIGIVGYMIIGLAIDSAITVAPVFWLIFGIAYCIMETLLDEQDREDVRDNKKQR